MSRGKGAIWRNPGAHVQIETSKGCWLWMRYRNALGYGRFWIPPDRLILAHRWFYEKYVGPIPADSEIDHLCRVPACVNPAHLEAVSHSTNVYRGKNNRRNVCHRGHELVPPNLKFQDGGRRGCLTCFRAYSAKWQRDRRRTDPEFRARQLACNKRWRDRQKVAAC